ncbi:type 4 pilus major pilin [Castellaniella sp. UC4442_H9]
MKPLRVKPIPGISNRALVERHQRRVRGRGSFIFELMAAWQIYTVIFIIALAGVYLLYQKFWVQNETQNVNTIYLQTVQLKSASGGYGADTDLVPILIATDSLPRSISRGTDDRLYNRYGGEIQVQASDNGMYFTITQNDVPANKCPEMVQALSNSGSFRSIAAGSTTITTLPVTIGDATTACGSGDAVPIAFTTIN